MSFTRVAPDLNQPVPLPDGSLNIKWTYKKGQFEDEIFPSLVELQIDNKVYVTGRVLSATDELTIPPADLAKLAGVGAVLSVLLVFHFSGEGNDLLPAGTASDLKNVAVKPWRPERIPPPPPPDPGENRRGIRVVRGADIAGVAFRPIAASWGQGRIDLFRTGGVLREVWNNGGLAHAWHDQGFHAWETVYGDSPEAYASVRGLMPDAVSVWGEERLDIFASVRDFDHYELLHGWYDKKWGEWENLGPPPIKEGIIGVAATSWGKGRIDVITSGTHVFHTWYERGWHGWEELTPRLGTDVTVGLPGMASPAVGAFDVFAFGHLRSELEKGIQRFFLFVSGYRDGTPTPWRRWTTVEVPGLSMEEIDFSAPPKPVPTWTKWGKLGETLESKYDVFVKTRDGLIWRLYEVPGGSWTFSPVAAPPLGAKFEGGFDVVSWSEGRFDLFVSGSDGLCYHYWSENAGHSFTGPEIIR